MASATRRVPRRPSLRQLRPPTSPRIPTFRRMSYRFIKVEPARHRPRRIIRRASARVSRSCRYRSTTAPTIRRRPVRHSSMCTISRTHSPICRATCTFGDDSNPSPHNRRRPKRRSRKTCTRHCPKRLSVNIYRQMLPMQHHHHHHRRRRKRSHHSLCYRHPFFQ